MMALPEFKKSGKLEEEPYDSKKIEWVIDDFFSILDSSDFLLGFWKSPKFTFNDIVYQLSLRIDKEGLMDLYLCLTEWKEKYQLKYDVELKNFDSKELYFENEILVEGQRLSITETLLTELDYFKLYEMFKWESSSDLTVVFTLKCAKTNKADQLDKTKPLKLINLDKLSDNFKNLFANKETCDTTLKVKDKDFKAHRLVLMARSSVFAATFKHDSLESQTGVINIPDCDPVSFEEFLEYLYCGKLEEMSLSSALNLYYTSDKYEVQELKAFCVEFLVQCLAIENVCEIAVLADKYDELQLYSAVEKFFNENTFEIMLTTDWDNLLSNDHRLANKLLKQLSRLRVKK